jgi:hypothetical protein
VLPGNGSEHLEDQRLKGVYARLSAIERRLEDACGDERVHEVLRAHEFQLIDAEGEARALLAFADGDSAQLIIRSEAGGAALRADAEGSLIALMDASGSLRFFANHDAAHGARVGLSDQNEIRIIELTEFPGGAGALFRDPQGRQRIVLLVGGREQDTAEMALMDGMGDEGVLFKVPAIRQDPWEIAAEGWPVWITAELEAIAARIRALEDSGRGTP